MPPALTPELAIAYVRELSADVRAVAVLAADGALLAGDAAVAAAARPLLAAGAEAEAVTASGVVCTARDERHALVAACGRFALPSVVRTDLRAALAGLAGTEPQPPPERAAGHRGSALSDAAAATISAVQRAPGA
jgi:hypothetical protein